MGKILTFTQTGNFKKTDKFLSGLVGGYWMSKLHYYGRKGVKALKEATPKQSGETAEAWSYEIVQETGRTAIYWKNSHVVNGVNIAIILQYGHASRNGSFVEGTDYIGPAIRPIFEEMAREAWKEVVQ